MKEYKYKINGSEYNVAIIDMDATTAAVEVNGVSYKVDILSEVFAKPEAPKAAPAPQPVAAPAPQPKVEAPAPAQPAPQPVAQPVASGRAVQSPLPGQIIDVKVQVGDAVKAGQTVAVLEAMKMENAINAEFDGVVTAVKVSKGDSILEGTDIVIIG